MEELEKDGDRLISYIDFYDTILVVIQRGFADDFTMNVKRDAGLRQSILYQWLLMLRQAMEFGPPDLNMKRFCLVSENLYDLFTIKNSLNIESNTLILINVCN